MAALNLDQNKDNLVSAWREVMDEKCPTDWALFAYDGLTFDLNLHSKGDGGLEELIEDFSSGKIMYALCRVKVKEKNVEKIVLINWQGEGSSLARKGMAANHLGRIQSFFKGIHITINARTDEDVEPDAIISHVSKSTAGEGVKHSTAPAGIVGPVGTTYKKVNPKDDINSAAKDEFWRLEEQEEERRKRDEQQKFRKFSQNEVKLLRRESQEYFNEKDEPLGSKSLINPSSEKLNNGGGSSSNGTSSLNSSFNSAKDAAVKASTPLKSTLSSSSSGNSGDLVRQRIKSFDTGTPRTPISSYTSVGSATTTPSSTTTTNSNKPSINSISSNGGGNSNENNSDETVEKLSVLKRRQLFENVTTSSYSPPLKSSPAQEIKLAQEREKAAVLKQKQQEQEEEPKPSSNITTTPNTTTTTVNNNNSSSSSSTPLSSKVDNNNAFNTIAKSPLMSSSPSPPVSTVVVVPQVQKSISPTPPPPTQAQTTQEIRSNGVNSGYEHNNTQVVSNNGYTAHGGGAGDVSYNNQDYNNPKANYISNNEPERVNGSLKTDQKHVEQDAVIERESTSTPTIDITPEMGMCARALYDYQAADDSEISFDPAQIITNIEQIDEGWWEGLGPDGIYGLFPANYVELLN